MTIRAFPIQNMTPIWIFPAYPLLLTAPFASNLIEGLPTSMETNPDNFVAMIFGSMTLQGMGFLVSLNIYGAFIYRLMTQKLPNDMLKPGMVSFASLSRF
jgi:tellurite resistance protein TehA-like permease